MKKIIVIGYSGHGFVVKETLTLCGFDVKGYCDVDEKHVNPYSLTYKGKETELSDEDYKSYGFFAGIGNNGIRCRVSEAVVSKGGVFVNAIHPHAIISGTVTYGAHFFAAAGVCINALTSIGTGVICNTSSSIDHECIIGDFTHIAPGAVLCGNVKVGEKTFIGANAVIKQGVTLGNGCIVGAGSVVVKNVADGEVVMGNPARLKSIV